MNRMDLLEQYVIWDVVYLFQQYEIDFFLDMFVVPIDKQSLLKVCLKFL